jgi:hypothetical protein
LKTEIKNTLRVLALCDHPIERRHQLSGPDGCAQCCADCGAFRILMGRVEPAWTRSAIAVRINALLVNGALEAKRDSDE